MSRPAARSVALSVAGVLAIVFVASAAVVWFDRRTRAADLERARVEVRRLAAELDARPTRREPLWWPAEAGDADAAYVAAGGLVESWFPALDELGVTDPDDVSWTALAEVAAGRTDEARAARAQLLGLPAVGEALERLARGTSLSDVGLRTDDAVLDGAPTYVSGLSDLAPAFVTHFVDRVERGDDHTEAVRDLLPLFQCALDLVASPDFECAAAWFAMPPCALRSWLAEGRYGELDGAARDLLRSALADLDAAIVPLGDDLEFLSTCSVAQRLHDGELVEDDDVAALRSTVGDETIDALVRPPWSRRGGSEGADALAYLASVRSELAVVRGLLASDPDAAFARFESDVDAKRGADDWPTAYGRLEVAGEARIRVLILHELRALRIALARFEGDRDFTLDDPYGSVWVVLDDASGVRVGSDSRWNEGDQRVFVAR
ncbi:MAG: hypothetical protein R3F34_06780 [Planctomycetota bacterium]